MFAQFQLDVADIPVLNNRKRSLNQETKASSSAKKVKTLELESDGALKRKQVNKQIEPFVSPSPAKYRERYTSVCVKCFEESQVCCHYEENPLDLLLLGHNPSDHAWQSGFFYSNPSNRMWKLLTGNSIGKDAPPFEGVLPRDAKIEDQNIMPSTYGIGFTDLGLVPGNNAQEFGRATMEKWGRELSARLKAHEVRAGKPPSLIAFTGKRQLTMILPKQPNNSNLEYGHQPDIVMPAHWPFSTKTTQIWLLPSSSGRAVMTHAQRTEPYRLLALELAKVKAKLRK